MNLTEHDRQALRTGIERLVRLTPLTGLSVDSAWPDGDGLYGTTVCAGNNDAEPPPLTAVQQLAVSALLGEEVPAAVLLSAMEDAGMFPGGVYATVEKERERIVFPVAEYPTEDSARESLLRQWNILTPVRRDLGRTVSDLTFTVTGRRSSTITRMAREFVEVWVGPRVIFHTPTGSILQRPTAAWMRRQADNLPSLQRILAHLRRRAKPKTADTLSRMIAHLDAG